MRTQKTVNGKTAKYYYNGNLLLGEEKEGGNLYYYYGDNGQVIGLRYNDENYYTLRNLQGDVTALIDHNGTNVVSYVYDSWGTVISVTGSLAGTLGKDNPIRYRGYYYDEESGLYYLQSRYYDPGTLRFLNADAIIGANAEFYNLFAYCKNNPVNLEDKSGMVAYTGSYDGGQIYDPNMFYITNSEYEKKKIRAEANAAALAAAAARAAKSSKTPTKRGKSIYTGSIRICTDGSDGSKVPDGNHLFTTAHTHNGDYLDAYTVPYVVRPIGDNSIRMGETALLINHDTGMSVLCVVGEAGLAKNGWGEVSIKAIWDTGNPDHMTAKHTSGLSTNYEIIIYPGIPYDWGD